MGYAVNTLEHHFLPFTANRDFKANPRLIVRGEGVHYWNHKGGKILDGSSGLFCCGAGHARKEIAEAVAKQLTEVEFTPHFQLAHPSSFEVARRIAHMAPEGLNRVFFGNSGSEAVDSAMKIALAYWRAKGEGHRVRFVARERAYHGVNFGGTSLQGMVKNREAFGVLLPGVVHMRHTWLPENRFSKGQPEKGAELADDLQRICDTYGGSNVAACVVEPIAGSTGALVPPKGYLERLRAICDKHGILLVFDEVITGVGRTGKAFAAQSFAVKPDMITFAKAITNAAQPMGGVILKEDIYDTIVDAAPPGAIELFHGYTYSAHPAACAAALATLDIYEREGLFQRAAELSPYFLDAVFSLKGAPGITDIRGYGLIAGFDVEPGKTPGARGTLLQKQLFANGLHVKCTGDAGILAPPFVAKREHVDQIVDIIKKTMKEV
jgi:beta-alanine--pyruvate transaminase